MELGLNDILIVLFLQLSQILMKMVVYMIDIIISVNIYHCSLNASTNAKFLLRIYFPLTFGEDFKFF